MVARYSSLALLLILTAGAACGDLFGNDDTTGEAGINWLEVASLQTGLQIRVIGEAGCGGLARIDVTIRPPGYMNVTEVILNPRARATEALCLVPFAFDTTLIIAMLGSQPPSYFSITSGSAIFVSFGSFVIRPGAKFVGGWVAVDTRTAGCPLLRAAPGTMLSSTPRYALEPIPGIDLADGTGAWVRARLEAGTTPTCAGELPLHITHLAINLVRSAV